MLSGIVGLSLLSLSTVHAADLEILTKAPPALAPLPAVDGFNGKVDGFAGSAGNKSVYGAEGALSAPLPNQYGFQLDGRAGTLDSSGFGSIGGHLFWRNPTQAMFGLYGDFTDWDRFGGVRVGHAAFEGAYYLGHFTVEGVAGVEFGNSVSAVFPAGSSTFQGTTIVAPGTPFPFTPGTITTTTTTTNNFLLQTIDIRTRFFDQVDVAYYPTDNWKAYIGHRYLGGLNAAAFGTELGLPLGHGLLGSAFVEARVGEQDFHGIWGGLKLYFGRSDKPLIDRHRRDDPPIWSADSLFSILNNQSTSSLSNTNQSSTTQQFCDPNSEFPILQGGTCQSPAPPPD